MTHPLRSLGLSLLILLACDPSGGRPSAAEQGVPAQVRASADAFVPTTSYGERVRELDRHIEANVALAETKPEGWLAQAAVSKLYSQRGRLRGSYGDYGEAQAYMARAFAIPGCAAYGARAKLNLSLHRLNQAEADIAILSRNPPPDDISRSTLADLQGELAFQRGDYPKALASYEEAHRIRPRPESWARLGVYRWKTGDYPGATAAFQEAEAMVGPSGDPMFLAWLHLQRGLMDLDLGRFDAALEDYKRGDALLPGWWLIEEHIAEILTLQGKGDEALELYLQLIKETQNPEFMDAAAELLQAAGRDAQARAMTSRSRARYQERLRTFPEATWGHALDHFLTFDPQGTKALELAEANAALRPSAPGHINLAKARLAAGDPSGAREAIDKALGSQWRSLELYEVGAEVYTALGEGSEAAALRAKGEAFGAQP